MSNPWSKFFWQDWEGDKGLALCSLAAQGLWMRMLCVAAAHNPIGYVAVAGVGLNSTELAALTGVPLPEIENLLKELSTREVYSVDRKGRMYSRRMIRDVKRGKISRENGKLGGNPSLANIKQNKNQDNLTAEPWDKPHKPEAISQLPESKKEEGSEAPQNMAPKDELTEAIAAYNAVAEKVGWPVCVFRNKQRDAGLRGRLREVGGLDGWRSAMQRAARSSFLRGDAPRKAGHENWRPTLGFFLQPGNLAKLLEGAYDDPGDRGDEGASVVHRERMLWLKEYAQDGRWQSNKSGNGVWRDPLGIGPPPHQAGTLVTEADLDLVPGAGAMKSKLTTEENQHGKA